MLIACTGFSGCSTQTGEPSLAAIPVHDGVLDLSGLRDEIIILNYWAEWCGPCHEEIPELNKLDREPEFIVLGVDFDGHDRTDLPAVLARMDIAFPQLEIPPGQLWPELGRPSSLPHTVLIRSGQQVIATLQGPQTRASIAAALQESIQPIENLSDG